MILPALLSFLTPAAPQSDGNLMGAAATVFVDATTASGNGLQNAAHGHLKLAGLRDHPPTVHPLVPGRPDFTPAAVPWAAVAGEIDAFSTDINWIAATPDGQATASAGGNLGWAGVVVSTTRTTQGLPLTAIAHEAAAGDVAGDVFQYLFPDSVGVPAALRDRGLRIIDSAEVRLLPGGGEPPDVVAIDLFVPMLLGDGVTFGHAQSQFQRVWFSVSAATVPAVNPGWWGSQPPSGATVLETRWIASTGWTTPAAVLGPQDLGLEPADDVDALAFDGVQGYLLFSTATGHPDPIMFKNLASPSVWPFRLPNGVSVAERIGLVPTQPPPIRLDDVNAICAVDPRIPNARRWVATPLPEPFELGAALWRDFDHGEGQETMVALANGFVDNANEAESLAVFWLLANGVPSYPLFGTYVSSPATIEHRLPAVPLVGATVQCAWYQYDASLSVIARSAPLSIDV